MKVFLMNLRSYRKSAKSTWFLMMLVEIAIIAILMFAYGVYVSNKIESEEQLKEGQVYSVIFQGDNPATKGNVSILKNVLPDILSKHGESVEVCLISCYGENEGMFPESVLSQIAFHNGKLIHKSDIPENAIVGRPISDEDEQKGNKVCVLSANFESNISDVITLCGESYEVIAVENEKTNTLDKFNSFMPGMKTAYIPFLVLPDEMSVSTFALRFQRVITAPEIRDINRKLQAAFGDQIIEYPKGIQVSYNERKTFRTIMFVGVCLALLAGYCLIYLYLYRIELRKKEQGVYLLCGAHRTQIWGAYLVEIGIQVILAEICGYFLFMKLIRPYLDESYKWFAYVFTERINRFYQVGLVFDGILLLLSAFVLWRRIRKMPIALLRG